LKGNGWGRGEEEYIIKMEQKHKENKCFEGGKDNFNNRIKQFSKGSLMESCCNAIWRRFL
jgi:hypothetical protein